MRARVARRHIPIEFRRHYIDQRFTRHLAQALVGQRDENRSLREDMQHGICSNSTARMSSELSGKSHFTFPTVSPIPGPAEP
jgi:hypothetical protein